MQLLEKIAGGNCELKLLQKNCWNQGKPKCQLAIIFATCCCAGASAFENIELFFFVALPKTVIMLFNSKSFPGVKLHAL